ncbi:GL27081 [Drosophila persimilis]|uniref:GL27081 n=1 Tax=Drosophila persimilis TaxID=7234 RepID=B4HBX3_DROPE|nr:GL27081 [Drosophila persimilis]
MDRGHGPLASEAPNVTCARFNRVTPSDLEATAADQVYKTAIAYSSQACPTLRGRCYVARRGRRAPADGAASYILEVYHDFSAPSPRVYRMWQSGTDGDIVEAHTAHRRFLRPSGTKRVPELSSCQPQRYGGAPSNGALDTEKGRTCESSGLEHVQALRGKEKERPHSDPLELLKNLGTRANELVKRMNDQRHVDNVMKDLALRVVTLQALVVNNFEKLHTRTIGCCETAAKPPHTGSKRLRESPQMAAEPTKRQRGTKLQQASTQLKPPAQSQDELTHSGTPAPLKA